MRGLTPILLLLGVFALAALPLLWTESTPVAAGRSAPRDSSLYSTSAEPAGRIVPPLMRTRVTGPEPVLELVVDERQAADFVSLWVAYRTAPTCGGLGQPLPTAESDASRDQWQTAERTGSAYAVRTLPGQWTWVGILALGTRTRLRYLCVPPFDGTQTRQLDLAATDNRLHVFLDGSPNDHRQTLRLFGKGIRDATAPALRRQFAVSVEGYAVISDVPEGLAFVCAPGASPEEPAPHVDRMLFGPGGGRDRIGRVVPESPSGTVSVHVTLTGRPPGSLNPVLYLCGIGSLRDQVVPVMTRFRLGENPTVTVRVPQGRYLLRVLPLGVLGGIPGTTYTVFPDTEAEIRCDLSVPEDRVELAIRGVPRKCRPFSVLLRDSAALDVSREAVGVIGSYVWNRATQRVPATAVRARLDVRARGAWYVSRAAVDLACPPSAPVDVEPAAHLSVLVEAPRILESPGVQCVLDSRCGRERVRLVSFWSRDDGRYRRSLRAEFLAPVGGCSVTLVDEAGRILHRASLQLAAGSRHVRIE